MASMMNDESVEEVAGIYPESSTEKELRKDEGRLKMIKNALENVELTISEIKELKGILVSKKRVFEWESERTKLRNVTRSSHRKTCPQLTNVALEKIFSSLSTKDVLSSRLVCQNWQQVATMELRKRTLLSFWKNGRDKTKNFFEVMKESQLLPVTSFTLNMKHVQDKDFHLVIEFFQIFGPVIETLYVDFTGSTVDPSLFETPLKMYLDTIQLENLINLTITFREDEGPSSAVDIRTSLIRAYFGSSKNLETLKLHSDNSSLLLRSLNNGPTLSNLNILFLETAILRDNELGNLGRDLKLKRLCLRFYLVEFKSETMKEFLRSQSETLEYLKLFPYSPSTEFIYEFPRMENLKILSIAAVKNRSLRFGRMDWNESFPQLKEFKMRGGFAEHWMESLFPSDSTSVHFGLEILDLPNGFRCEDVPMNLSVVSRVFPNIRTIKLAIQDLVVDRRDWDSEFGRPFCGWNFSRTKKDLFLSYAFSKMKRIVLRCEEDFVAELHSRIEDEEEEGIWEEFQMKKFLKKFAWSMDLDPGIKHSCEQLTTAAFEMKFGDQWDKMGPWFVRQTYDCTWFLRLLRERVKLEQLADKNLNRGRPETGGIGITLPSYDQHDWVVAGNLAEERTAIAEEFRFRRNPTEMRQREENEPRFKIMKRIVQNIPLTIPEIHSFMTILVEKERAFEREAEWSKQVETQSGEIDLPQLPDLALENIFSCQSLSTTDILSSRLVCRRWRFLATKELRKRFSKKFTFNRESEAPGEDLKELLEDMMRSQLFSAISFYVDWNYIEGRGQSDEMKIFLQIFAPILSHLTLDFDYYDGLPTGSESGGFKAFREDLSITRLKKLESLTFKFLDHWSRTDYNPTLLVSACFGSAQNLKKLKIKSDRSPTGLLKSLENHPLPHLDTLMLFTGTLSDAELENLGLVVNLRRLSLKIEDIGFRSESMTGFLQSQSKTMEYLKLFSKSSTEFIYEFPRMERLKVFDIRNIQNLRLSQIDWNKSFPKLEELKFLQRDEFEESWTEPLFPPNTRSNHPGLKIIALSCAIVRSLSFSLPVIGEIFPNVRTLKICAEDFLNPILLDTFPNLNKIIISFGNKHFGSGEECKNHVKKLIWDMTLDFRGLGYSTRLTVTGFEIKEYERGEFGTWKTYDCPWVLGLLQERIKLEQLDDELRTEAALKTGFTVLNLEE